MCSKFINALLLMFLLSSCGIGEMPGGGETGPDLPILKILDPTSVSETGFQLNWSISNPVGFDGILVLVAEDREMTKPVRYMDIDDPGKQSVLISGLDGASMYFYRITLTAQGQAVTESEIKAIETTYRMDNTSLLTGDDYTLSGKLAYLESVSGSRPGIIMMHEFGVWVNPWIGSDLLKKLVSDGYICFTFFFRGHGTSTPMDDLMELINNKNLLTRDLQAAIEFMNESELVTSGQLGLIGGSMGATMALAGNGYEEVKTSVALSPAADGVFLLFPDMTLSSVYYLVGELDIQEDPGADFPEEALTLYNLTEDPRKLDMIPGTADHGTGLLKRDSLNTSVEDWFLQYLPNE